MYKKFLLDAITVMCDFGSFILIHLISIADIKKSPILSVLNIKYLFTKFFYLKNLRSSSTISLTSCLNLTVGFHFKILFALL